MVLSLEMDSLIALALLCNVATGQGCLGGGVGDSRPRVCAHAHFMAVRQNVG